MVPAVEALKPMAPIIGSFVLLLIIDSGFGLRGLLWLLAIIGLVNIYLTTLVLRRLPRFERGMGNRDGEGPR